MRKSTNTGHPGANISKEAPHDWKSMRQATHTILTDASETRTLLVGSHGELRLGIIKAMEPDEDPAIATARSLVETVGCYAEGVMSRNSSRRYAASRQ